MSINIIEAIRARYGVGARNTSSASASGCCERLGALVPVLLELNRSLPQSCTKIYNDDRRRVILVEKGFAVNVKYC